METEKLLVLRRRLAAVNIIINTHVRAGKYLFIIITIIYECIWRLSQAHPAKCDDFSFAITLFSPGAPPFHRHQVTWNYSNTKIHHNSFILDTLGAFPFFTDSNIFRSHPSPVRVQFQRFACTVTTIDDWNMPRKIRVGKFACRQPSFRSQQIIIRLHRWCLPILLSSKAYDQRHSFR